MKNSLPFIYSFPPVVSRNSKVLILGSMPGEVSLKAHQYYAHPRNAFWRIMGELFGAGPSLPYQERLAVLDSAGIALWDSLRACTRPGSLDSAIRDEEANDFANLFASFPRITHVFFNGAKSEAAFRHHVLPTLGDPEHVFVRLPSSSPAHAGMTFDKKVEHWRAVANALS
jgi:TDG/mug DNA glycosylase family protein